MKRLKLAALMIVFSVTSCGKSEDADAGGDADVVPEHKDQSLQGRISGVDLNFKGGRVRQPFSNRRDQINWEFTFVGSESENPCDEFVMMGDDGFSVIFSDEPKPGKTNFGLSTQNITLVDSNKDPIMNTIVTSGWIEYTKIEAGSVSGKIIGRYNDDNFINGNFTIPRCCRQAGSDLEFEACKE
jgi:hypothetical protein